MFTPRRRRPQRQPRQNGGAAYYLHLASHLSLRGLYTAGF